MRLFNFKYNKTQEDTSFYHLYYVQRVLSKQGKSFYAEMRFRNTINQRSYTNVYKILSIPLAAIFFIKEFFTIFKRKNKPRSLL